MRSPRLRRFLATALLCAGPCALADSPPSAGHLETLRGLSAEQASDGHLLLAWDYLKALSSTRLAISGELDGFDHQAECLALTERLLQRGREQPVLLWPLANGERCADVAIAQRASRTLVEIDPGNLAAHLLLLATGAAPADADWFAAARDATRYESYQAAFLKLHLGALRELDADHPLLAKARRTYAESGADDAIALSALGHAMARADRANTGFAAFCDGADAAALERQASCRRLAATIADRGDTLEAVQFGLLRWLKLSTDADERSRLQKREAELGWQIGAQAIQSVLDGPGVVAAYVQTVADSGRRPYEVYLELLTAAGMELAPPAGETAADTDEDLPQWRIDAQRDAEQAERVAQSLSAHDDPWSAYVAAELLRIASLREQTASRGQVDDHGMPPHVLPLLRRALRDAADPALLQALLIRKDTDWPAAERRQALRRLYALDPDNLALLAFDPETVEPRQVEALALRLQQPFGGTAFRLYYGATIRAVFATLERLQPDLTAQVATLTTNAPTQAENAGAMMAVNLALATPLPGMQPWSQACDPGRPDWRETARPGCLRAAQAMASSDTVLAEGLGLRMWRRLLPQEGADAAQALQAHRDFLWRQEADMISQYEDATRTFASLAELARAPAASEAETMRERLRAAGLPLQAPDGWQPSSPERLSIEP